MTSVLKKNPVYFGGIGKFNGLSAFVLKVIALFVMLCDHTSVVFNGGELDGWRIVGRIGFPIFAFFIAEGAGRTHNIFKYMLRLGIFALISEIPFDLALIGSAFDISYQNVYFTLLLGLAAIWVYTLLAKKNLGFLSIFTTAAFAAVAYLLKTDYDATGVIVVFLFYFVIRLKMPQKIICTVLVCLALTVCFVGFVPYYNSSEMCAVFAAIPILLYNGNRGTYINKYFFYGFYPGHLLLIKLAFTIFERI